MEEPKGKEEEERKQLQQVWSWGAGTDGQLGTGKLEDELLPQPLHLPFLGPISALSCGGAHVIALTSSGQVLTWGRGTSDCWGKQVYGFGSTKRGQLGIINNDKMKSISIPELTCGFEGVEMNSIYANGDHSAALSADGHLYTWGRGFPGTRDVFSPQRLVSSLQFMKVALGWNHALALTVEGEVFILGGDRHGALGDLEKISRAKHLTESAHAVWLESQVLTG